MLFAACRKTYKIQFRHAGRLLKKEQNFDFCERELHSSKHIMRLKHIVLSICYESRHMFRLSNQNVLHFDLFTDADTCTASERKNIRSDY